MPALVRTKERKFLRHQADLLCRLHGCTKEAWFGLRKINKILIKARGLQPFEIQGIGYTSATEALVNFAKDFLANAVEAAEIDAGHPGASLIGWRRGDLSEWRGDLLNPWPDKLIATHIPAIWRHYADNRGSLPTPSILSAAVRQEWEIASASSSGAIGLPRTAEPLTPALSPKDLAGMLDISSKTFVRDFKAGKIGGEKITTKRYRILISQLPPRHQAKYLPAAK
jgi:hypothetical protein